MYFQKTIFQTGREEISHKRKGLTGKTAKEKSNMRWRKTQGNSIKGTQEKKLG